MYYPELALLGTTFFILREAIANQADVERYYFELEGHLILFSAPLNPRLSKKMTLAEYDANLPTWKEQFVERAKEDVDQNCYKIFLMGFEIGQLAAHLIGKLPVDIELSEFDFRKSKSLESIARLKALCVECRKSVPARDMIADATKQIEESNSICDLDQIAYMIAEWDKSPEMCDIVWSRN